jgi:hypothetical protein
MAKTIVQTIPVVRAFCRYPQRGRSRVCVVVPTTNSPAGATAYDKACQAVLAREHRLPCHVICITVSFPRFTEFHSGSEAAMTKQTGQKQTEQANHNDELNEAQLDAVSGGGGKTIDQASPNLFRACATGKHLSTGKLS